MSRTTVQRTIAAPSAAVFDAVAHIDSFSKVVPDIVDVEFLTESTRGAGTRFRETRMMRGREATTELEVAEYEPDTHVRLVSDEGGTVWDTTFTVEPVDGGSRLTMVMDARPHSLLAKVTTPMFKRMITKAVGADMDAVKEYCEAEAGS